MGETIISPWVFYLIDISEGLKFLFIAIGIVSLAIGLFVCMTIFDDPDFKGWYSFSRKMIVAALITIFLGIVLPSKEACYQMLLANYATYENVEAAGGQATEVIDYIFEKFDEAKTDNAD